jgi:hypothetical protein
MFNAARRLWQQHRLLVTALAAACLVTVFFGLRLVAFTIYWSQHRDDTIAGWMTLGYIAHSYDVGREELAAGLGVGPEMGHRLTVRDIAEQSGRPVSDIEAILLETIAAERGDDAQARGRPASD